MTLTSIFRWCFSQIDKGLSHALISILAAILGICLTMPSLWGGWYLDDVSHRLAYTRLPEAKEYFDRAGFAEEETLAGPMRMFKFLDGTSERAHRYMDIGVAPWWTYEEIRLSFWRPLTALTHVFDYSLWPSSAELMHLQSILWFALLIAAAGVFYRRIMGVAWAAGLAALLFTMDDAHGGPVSWLANRHALLAAFFGVLTLWAHDHWRKGDSEKWKYLAPLLLLLGLLSSEGTVATFGYLLSYTVFLDKGPITNRIKTLAPYVFLIIIWRFAYNILGYGASGSDVYIDPIREPLRFSYAILERLPILLLGGFAWLEI